MEHRPIPGLEWEFDLGDYSPPVKEIESLSDRAAVLVAAAFLDIRLADVLKRIFIKNDSQVLDNAFNPKGDGIVSSLGAKLRTAYLLGQFTRQGYLDLREIERIRNQFAHILQVQTFEDLNIKEGDCMKLKKVETFVLTPLQNVAPYVPVENASRVLAVPRNRFFHAISSYCSAMKNLQPPYF